MLASLVTACGEAELATAPLPTTAPSPRVVATVGVNATLPAPPSKAAELFSDRSVDAIVQGRVSAIEYRYADGAVAFTGVTISVERSNRAVPPEITSWELGGLIPVHELAESQRARMFGGKQVPDSALVDFAPGFGAKRAKVGDTVVLFLDRVTAGPTVGDYNALGDTLGRFVLGESGVYERAGTATDGSEARETLNREALNFALTR